MTSTLKVLEYETQDNSIPVLSTEIDEYFQVMSFFKVCTWNIRINLAIAV